MHAPVVSARRRLIQSVRDDGSDYRSGARIPRRGSYGALADRGAVGVVAVVPSGCQVEISRRVSVRAKAKARPSAMITMSSVCSIARRLPGLDESSVVTDRSSYASRCLSRSRTARRPTLCRCVHVLKPRAPKSPASPGSLVAVAL